MKVHIHVCLVAFFANLAWNTRPGIKLKFLPCVAPYLARPAYATKLWNTLLTVVFSHDPPRRRPTLSSGRGSHAYSDETSVPSGSVVVQSSFSSACGSSFHWFAHSRVNCGDIAPQRKVPTTRTFSCAQFGLLLTADFSSFTVSGSFVTESGRSCSTPCTKFMRASPEKVTKSPSPCHTPVIGYWVPSARGRSP